MAGVVLDDGEAVGFDVVLNGAGDIQQGVARLDLGQAPHQGFLGHAAEGLGFLTGTLADAEAHTAVPVVAVEVGPRIDLEQIAGLDHPLAAGDAVHHLVVDRGADAGWEAVVALKAGSGSHFADALFGMGVEIAGGHARGRHLQ